MKKIYLLLILCCSYYAGYSQVAAACTTPTWYVLGSSPSDGAGSFSITGYSGSNLSDAGIAAASTAITGYADRTTAIPNINLRQGDVYSSSVNWNPLAGNQFLQVWIDFNDDGNFAVSEEVSPVAPGTLSTTNPTNFNITIPLAANPGVHRLRLRAIWQQNSTSTGSVPAHCDPCLNSYLGTNPHYWSGTVTDYKCTIIALCVTPVAGPISGNTLLCGTGLTSALTTTSTAGGTWSSSNTGVATVDSVSGVVRSVSPGTSTITYTLSRTCGTITPSVNMTVGVVPAAISGTASVCAGFTTSLSSSPSGGVWTSSSNAQATVGSTGVVTGVSASTPTITYTLPAGCNTTSSFTVNLNPAPITGTTLICGAGQTTTLTEVTPGGSWSSSFTPVASISGTVGSNATIMGGSTGNATIGYTMPTGCLATTTVTVNNLAQFSVTGGGSYCAGSVSIPPIGLNGSTVGVNYQLLNGGSGVTTMAGTGVALNFGPQPAGGTYTVQATSVSSGCSATMTGSAVITVNPLPNVYPISSALNASYCAGGTGVPVILFNSDNGISYQLYNGITPVPPAITSGGGVLSFGPKTAAGTYTVVATNPFTTCSSNMTGSTTIAINPLPTVYAVTGGGSYCFGDPSGKHIGMAFSGSGINYTLYNGTTAVITSPGSNSGLDFGTFTATGTYTVNATNAISGCSAGMSGNATITVNALPAPHNVTGTNSYCAGGAGVHVGLDGSNAGISYQLYNGITPVGAPITGTAGGGAIDFGVHAAGIYTVVGTNMTTGCAAAMTGDAEVTAVAPPTAYVLSTVGSGHFCANGSGVDIILSGSDFGVHYQLYDGSTPLTSVPGNSFPIEYGLQTTAGVYTVVATIDGLGCPVTMTGSPTITIDPLPTAYTVTGGGGYCIDGTGKHVGLSFSQVGVNYQLYYNSDPIGTQVAGTGSGLDFGIQTGAGIYTVSGTNSLSNCSNNMTGGVVIAINPLPNNSYTVSTPGSNSYCAGGTGVDIMTSASDAGISYQLYRGSTGMGSLPGTGGEGSSGLDFGLQIPAGVYTVIAMDTTTGCSATLSGSVTVVINPLPTVFTLGGGGNYCTGGSGEDVILSGSTTGVNYQLYLSGSSLGDPVGGTTGSALDFGVNPGAGMYTATATDATTQCSVNMAGAPVITILPLPGIHSVTGGGDYCMGGTGKAVSLDGSDPGIHYQLYNDAGASGPYLSGTGIGLNFGLKTTAGNYIVVATNPATGCKDTMSSSAAVNIDSLPHVYTLIGGGHYCAGGSGETIALTYYDEGINYYLYLGGAVVDSIIGGVAPDFGMHTAAGVYTATATNPANGCRNNMAGRDTITIVSPTVYSVMGGGSYCNGGTGVHVGLSGSGTGVNYQLFNGGPIGDPVAGTGSLLDFGLETTGGIYTVVATDATYLCPADMAGSATVTVNSLPNVHIVSGGGRYCAGGTGEHVGLTGTDESISYQLYNGATAVGVALTGSGGSLDFGLHTAAGIYTVIATNPGTGCFDTMAASATITVLPLPTAYTVTVDNYGNYCAADTGLHVRLANSEEGVSYQLFRDGVPVGGLVSGTGGALDFGMQVIAGSYTVFAHDSGSACDNNMAGSPSIYIIPLPLVHNVTGGGSYCPDGAGVDVGLDGSQAGIWYQLYNGITPVGVPLYGTGVSLDFGIQPAGTYKVIGNSAITTCPNNMFGTAVVSVDSLQLPNITVRAYPGLGVGVWHIDSLMVVFTNGGSNPTFQWVINGNIIAGATNASFTHHEFFNGDSVVVMVTGSGPCGGLTATKGIRLTLHDVGVQQVSAVGGDMHLVPNPNKGTFSVKGNVGTTSDEQISLEVTNMLGQVIYSSKVMTVNGSIDEQISLSRTLANGMYLLNVRSATQNNVIHFVIEQ